MRAADQLFKGKSVLGPARICSSENDRVPPEEVVDKSSLDGHGIADSLALQSTASSTSLTMSPTRRKLLETSNLFIEEYNKWTVDSILSTRSPSCTHHVAPVSLDTPPRNNAEFAEFVGPLLSVFRDFRFSIVDDKETLIDVDKRKVYLHLRSHANTDVGPYENEYCFVLSITEAGDKVDEILEVVDSAYTLSFLKRLEGK